MKREMCKYLFLLIIATMGIYMIFNSIIGLQNLTNGNYKEDLIFIEGKIKECNYSDISKAYEIYLEENNCLFTVSFTVDCCYGNQWMMVEGISERLKGKTVKLGVKSSQYDKIYTEIISLKIEENEIFSTEDTINYLRKNAITGLIVGGLCIAGVIFLYIVRDMWE